MRRKFSLECLEDRFAPTVAVAYVNTQWEGLSDGVQIADANPFVPGDQAATIGTNAFATLSAPQANEVVILRGTHAVTSDAQFGTAAIVTVYTPAGLVLGNLSTQRTFHLNNNPSMAIEGKVSLSNATIDGGVLTGPGSIDVTGQVAFNNLRTSTSLTINATQNCTFTDVTNGGALNVTAGHTVTLSGFTNASNGRMIINGTANASDFTSGGTIAINGSLVNTGGTVLHFIQGSVTVVNRVGPVDMIGDGVIDTGAAGGHLLGGLIINYGIVGSASPSLFIVDAGSKAIGSGFYSSVMTQNGGTFSPGGGSSTMAVIGGDLNGAVTPATLTTTGTLTVIDTDFSQSSFAAGSGAGLYGNFSVTAAGVWTYTLDVTRPETILAFAHTGAFSDSFDVISADGTVATVVVRITP